MSNVFFFSCSYVDLILKIMIKAGVLGNVSYQESIAFSSKMFFSVLDDDDVPTMEPSPSVYCQTIARNIISGVLHTLCSAHQGLYLQRGEVFINCRQIQPSSGLPVAVNHFAIEIFRQPCCKSNSRLISPDIQEVCQFDEHKTQSIKTVKLQVQRIAIIVI